MPNARGCRNIKKKLGVSNTPYDGGRWVTDGGWWVTAGGWWVTAGGWWVTDGGWWVTAGGWWVTDGGWWVTDGGWWVTDGGWWVTDGGWWVTDGGWWVATKHQRVDAIVKKNKKKGERPYGTPCPTQTSHTTAGTSRKRRRGGGCYPQVRGIAGNTPREPPALLRSPRSHCQLHTILGDLGRGASSVVTRTPTQPTTFSN